MPLCHWPCSCYPNYSLGQTDDWMNEIYPLWVAAHGVLIVTPVNWYPAPTPPRPPASRAPRPRALELTAWPSPRHRWGRHFGLVVHGDSAGAEMLRRSL